MTTIAKEALTPRDISSLALLKENGLSLVEIRISKVSSVRGLLLPSVRLPENTKLLCVLRSGQVLLDLDACFIYEGDELFLLTDNEVAVRSLFTL